MGDMFADKLRMPCPVATNLCLEYPDPQASSNKAGFKFMRTTSLADSKSARFLPQLRDQSQEWRSSTTRSARAQARAPVLQRHVLLAQGKETPTSACSNPSTARRAGTCSTTATSR
jgi:hypothetical protein